MCTRRVNRFVLSLSLVSLTSFGLSSCDMMEPLVSLLGLDLLGVNPAGNFLETGELELSMLGIDESGGVYRGPLSEEVDVFVEYPDGEAVECEGTRDAFAVPAVSNRIALLVDASGSMERNYPEATYGDMCLTCPHDPDRMRILAAQDLVDRVMSAAPGSELAVMAFGPTPSPGWAATRVLSDFTGDTNALSAALETVDGSAELGTPLWDSLGEVLGSAAERADPHTPESLSRTVIVQGDFNDIDCSNFDPDDTVIIQGDFNDLEGDCGGGSSSGGSAGSTGGGSNGTDWTGTPRAQERTYVLVISDGDDRDSVNFTLDQLIDLAQQHNIIVHAIGLGPASASYHNGLLRTEEQVSAVTNLERLASETGGFYAAVSNPSALRALYQNIARGLTEGYSATTFNCDDGGRRGQGLALTSGDQLDGWVDVEHDRVEFSFIVP